MQGNALENLMLNLYNKPCLHFNENMLNSLYLDNNKYTILATLEILCSNLNVLTKSHTIHIPSFY